MAFLGTEHIRRESHSMLIACSASALLPGIKSGTSQCERISVYWSQLMDKVSLKYRLYESTSYLRITGKWSEDGSFSVWMLYVCGKFRVTPKSNYQNLGKWDQCAKFGSTHFRSWIPVPQLCLQFQEVSLAFQSFTKKKKKKKKKKVNWWKMLCVALL